MLLDILIPYYGDKEVIKEMVCKILESDLAKLNIRIVLLDNASEIELESSFLEKHIHNICYIRNDSNLGRVGNWNRALDFVKSDWYCFLFMGDKLKNIPGLIKELIKSGPSCNVLSFRMTMKSNADNKLIGKYILSSYGIHEGKSLIKKYMPLGLMPWGPLQTNVFRRNTAISSRFDNNDEYYADIKYILSSIGDNQINIIRGVHLEWLVNKNRTHFKISLSDFVRKDFDFISSYIGNSFYKLTMLKICLVIRAIIMMRHYGINESLKAVMNIVKG